jgi:3-deoxy-D-manno-octulosonic acid kinase
VNASAIVAPAGYERFDNGETVVVARAAAVAGVRAALGAAPTLHAWAAAAPGAQAFQGRGTAWGVRLPGGTIDVVVRHAHRGGVLRALRGDRYVWPGRAPWELETSLRLQEAGVRTPDLVAFALYPAGPGFCRCDVVTRRLPEVADLPVAWREGSPEVRDALLVAIAALLRDLVAAGAQHADLNAKNLYVGRDGGRWHAWVLDVDRVRFRTPNDADVAAQNLARLVRSLRKLRGRKAIDIADEMLARLTDLAGGRA